MLTLKQQDGKVWIRLKAQNNGQLHVLVNTVMHLLVP
jgi:hypothetical protein